MKQGPRVEKTERGSMYKWKIWSWTKSDSLFSVRKGRTKYVHIEQKLDLVVRRLA